jgi:hypothetical protein
MERFLKLNYFEKVSLGIMIGLHLFFFMETVVTYRGYTSSPLLPSYAAPLSYLLNGLLLARELFIFAGLGLAWLKKQAGWITGVAGLLFNILYYTCIYIEYEAISFNLLIITSLLFSIVSVAILFSPSVRQQLRIIPNIYVITACILVVFLLLHFYTLDLAMFIGTHLF